MLIDQAKVTERFNETGFPFQKWCLETIRNYKKPNGEEIYIRAISEWPYTHPPSTEVSLGTHGTADIVAVERADYYGTGVLMVFVFECKRADPEIKNWIFSKDSFRKSSSFILSRIEHEGDNSKEKLSLEQKIYFASLGYDRPEKYEFCNQGIEVSNDFGALNRNQEKKVYKFLKQACHGIVALESIDKREIKGLRFYDLQNTNSLVYIPVVVTTADLYIAKYDYEKVQQGDVSSTDINYGSPKEWLTYEFPLPDFLNHEYEVGVKMDYRTIFVVNDKALIKFLNGLSDASQIYGIDK